jgi:hypothetical protein
MKLFTSILLLVFLIGCDDTSVNIPAIVNANTHFVVLKRIKNDESKSLQDDYENLIGSNFKKNIIAKNESIYAYQNLNRPSPYKNIVIVKLDGQKLKNFFCFWIDYKKKELMYLVAPKKYIKLIDKSQWETPQSDKQIQKRIIKFIDNKEFEPEKLKQYKIFYHDLDRGEFSITEPELRK